MTETFEKLAEKERELAMRDERIGDLELKLKAQEKGFKDKITYLNQLVAKYKRQAEESAAQNAEFLLHSHRQNMIRTSVEYEKSTHDSGTGQHGQHLVNSRVSSASSSSSHGSSPRTKSSPKVKPALHPHAPKDSRPVSGTKHRTRAKIGTFEVPEGHPVLRDNDSVKVRAASGRRLSEQEEVIPDPKPFLRVTREQQKALYRSTEIQRQPSQPLPPIAKSSALSENMYRYSRSDVCSPKPPNPRNAPGVPSPYKADSANFKKLKERQKRSPQSGEIETLALEDITKNSVSSLRRAQEYGSD